MDSDLIAKAKAGDRIAFGQLVEQNYDFIHAVAWKWTRNRVEAEDVAQDVCIRLARAIGGYRQDGAFRTWLYTLVLNVVRDLARRASRERAKQRDWKDDPSTAPSATEDDGLDEVWTAVQTLPPKQRDAVMLVYSEGLDHREAATVLGCSESTVSWHLHEARKRLRIILGREVA